MTLGKGLGNPIGVDQRTISREYGYFTNVLIDIDLAKPVPDRITVKEEGGKEFMQLVEIPKFPDYYHHCKGIGHAITQCRGLRKAFQSPEGEGTSGREKGAQVEENGNAALQGRDNRAPGEQQRAANEECERMRTTNNERGTSQTQKEAATAEGVTRKQNDKEDCTEVRGGDEINFVEPTTAAGSQGVFTSPVATSNIFGVLEVLDDGTEGVHEGVRGEPDTNQQ